MLRIRNLYKLVTREDYGHLHKIAGGASLLHYLYRGIRWAATGSMGFEYDWRTLCLIAVHAFLSGSAMFFHLSSKRNRKLPMIFPEFRVHSIIFAYRSIVCMLAAYLEVYNSAPMWITRPTIVFATIVAADMSSNHFVSDEKTMRGMPFPDCVSEDMRRLVTYYYNFSQFGATTVILSKRGLESPFVMMFPIQLAAFLMTLVKKNIISPGAWHILYAGSLALGYIHTKQHADPTNRYSMALVTAAALRLLLRANKYMVWAIACAIIHL